MKEFNIGDTAYVICIMKNLVGEQIWAYEIVEIKDIAFNFDMLETDFLANSFNCSVSVFECQYKSI